MTPRPVVPEPLCAALSCLRVVPSPMVFCREHWAIVPRYLRHEVWAAYVPDDPDNKKYLDAIGRAIVQVGLVEGTVTGTPATTDDPTEEALDA